MRSNATTGIAADRPREAPGPEVLAGRLRRWSRAASHPGQAPDRHRTTSHGETLVGPLTSRSIDRLAALGSRFRGAA